MQQDDTNVDAYTLITRSYQFAMCYWCGKQYATRFTLQLFLSATRYTGQLPPLVMTFLDRQTDAQSFLENHPTCDKCLCAFLRSHFTVPTDLQIDIAALLSLIETNEVLWLLFKMKPDDLPDVLFRWPSSCGLREDVFPLVVTQAKTAKDSPFMGRG